MLLRMRLKIFIATILIVWVPHIAIAQLDLDKIFWDQKQITILSEIQLVASYKNLNSKSFLFRNNETSELFVIDESRYFKLNNRSLRIKQITADHLIFESEQDQIFSYKITDFFIKDAASLNTVMLNDKKADEKNDELVRILDRDLEGAREILRSFGLPNFLLREPSKYLKLSHSRAGRPGLEFTNEIPDFLSKMIPFKKKDLILSVDTISAVDIDRLLLQLQNKVKNDVFNVEIERAGKLKLLRVSM
ncbi:hypothetical protein N9E68_00540 [Amylibacter sp.]|nr:hypothetical protein [Amylibacter sp.]